MAANRRGMGSVFREWYKDKKTRERRQVETFTIQYSVRGKTIRVRTGLTSESVAIKELKKKLGESGAGRLSGPDVERTTFDDLASLIESDYVINERRTLDDLKARIKEHLRPAFGGVEVVNIDEVRIGTYVLARLAEGAKKRDRQPRACRAQANVPPRGHRPESRARAPHRHAEGAEHAQGVLRGLPVRRRAGASPRGPTASGRGRLHHRVAHGQRDHHEEVAPRRPQGRVVEAGAGRNEERRGADVPADPPTARRPEAPAGRNDRAWAGHESGHPIRLLAQEGSGVRRAGQQTRGFYKAWKTACVAAGVPGRLRHDFRRTAVRNLERAGVPISAAMKMVGHKTDSIYRRHAIVDESMLREAGAKLSALHRADRSAR